MEHLSSKALSRWLMALILLVLLLANLLTPKVADDWSYMLSFATGEPISGLGDILPSMRAHARHVNGRVFAHALVQVFEFLPKAVFDVINAGVFVVIMELLFRLARRDREENVLLRLALFAGVWVFTPVFGQVFLWLDGAVNYAWGAALTLLWLQPYFARFLRGERRGAVFWLLWAVLGFVVGAYMENIGVTGIVLAAALLLLRRFVHGEKLRALPWLGVAAAAGGFVFLFTQPAEALKGSEGFMLTGLAKSFIGALRAYGQLAVPALFFAGALVLCLALRTDRDRLILAVTLFLGSLFSNFLLTAAAYYPARCLLFPALLLIAADALLLRELMDGCYAPLAFAASAMLTLALLYNGIYGMGDIVKTRMEVRANEAYIAAAREAGEKDIAVPLVEVLTKYSPLYDLRYLDTNDPNTWPNADMAKLLGVESLLGVREEDGT